MQMKETRTQYAAIHPRFPVGSLAQVWVKGLPEALLHAAEVHKAINEPIRVMSRTTVTVTDFEDVITIGGTPPGTANGERCAEFEENGSCIHSDHTN